MTKINNVDYGVTSKGNFYEKSKIDRKIGTAIGAATVAAMMAIEENKTKKQELPTTLDIAKSMINKGYRRGMRDLAKEYLVKSEEMKSAELKEAARELFSRAAKFDVKDSIYTAFAKTRNRRIAFVSSILASGIALKVGIGAFIGNMLGRLADKINDARTAAVIDKYNLH